MNVLYDITVTFMGKEVTDICSVTWDDDIPQLIKDITTALSARPDGMISVEFGHGDVITIYGQDMEKDMMQDEDYMNDPLAFPLWGDWESALNRKDPDFIALIRNEW